ncbi:MAG TPA: 5'-nucleotidase [Longimicrobiales bacterium]
MPGRSDTAAVVDSARADTSFVGPSRTDTVRTGVRPVTATATASATGIIATLAMPLRRQAPPDTAGAPYGMAGAPAESPLGRVVADAVRAATGAHVAIIETDAIRGDLEAGPLVREEAQAVLPAELRLFRLELTGGQLHAVLEDVVGGPVPRAHVSGIIVWYDPTRPAGRRVLTAELTGGAPVSGDRLYTVAVTDRMAAGAGGFHTLRTALLAEDTGILARDALADYLGALAQPVQRPEDARLRAMRPR